MTVQPPSGSFRDYRPDVDGLRAIAILTVVAYHLGVPGAPGGFIGVDVFFVISGYLITQLLLREVEATGAIRLAAFAARRIRRLLPAFLAMMLVTLVLGAWMMFPQELPRLGKSAMSAALISSNVHFLKFTGGYFDPSTDLMPMLHTWSLGLEEQYYIVWPLLFLGAAVLARRLGQRPSAWIGRMLLVVFVASLAFNIALVETHQSHVFYLMPYRAWEFALGGSLNWLRPGLARLSRPFGEGLFLTGLVAVLGSAALFSDQANYPGWLATIPTLGAAAIIAAGGVSVARLPRKVLGASPMVGIGLLSYSWYLWHWPMLALARSHNLGARDMLRDSVMVVLSLVLAWLTYRWIEAPIRFRKPWAFASTRGSLTLGIAMVLVMLAGAAATVEWGKRRQTELFKLTGQTADTGLQVRLDRCSREKDLYDLELPEHCSLGPSTAPIAIEAWGDSHIDHWGPLLNVYAEHARARILTRVQPTCPPLLGAVPYKRNEGLQSCGKYNERVMKEIGRLAGERQLKGVILAARWNEYLARQETDPAAMLAWALADQTNLGADGKGRVPVGIAPHDHAGSTRTLATSLRRTLEALATTNVRVLIIAPVPELYFHGPQCIYLRSAGECTTSRYRVEERRKAALWAIRAASLGMTNVRMWDPIDGFCDEQRCYAARDGIVLYTDHNHVSPKKAAASWQVAHSALAWLAGE